MDAGTVEHYRDLFASEMFVCDLVAFALFLAVICRRRPELAGWLAAIYLAFTSIMCELLYGWLDVGLLMLLMAWAWCWTRSLSNEHGSRRWAAAAFFVLGLSISYKVVPIIMTPYLLLGDGTMPADGCGRCWQALRGSAWVLGCRFSQSVRRLACHRSTCSFFTVPAPCKSNRSGPRRHDRQFVRPAGEIPD